MKMLKKVLFIAPLPPPIGGASVSTQRLMENKLFRSNIDLKGVVDISSKTEIESDKKLFFSDLLRAVIYILEIFLGIFKADTVLFWTSNKMLCTFGPFVILLCKIFRKKIIVKTFGGGFKTDYEALPDFQKKIVRWSLKQTGYLLPQTIFLKEYFKSQLNVEENKVIHYTNFIPSEIINTSGGIPPPVQNLKCIFISRIIKEKGIFDILDAIDGVHNVNCDFYGTLAKEDKNLFLSRINNMPNAAYKGELDQKEVCKMISGYHILLLPSYYHDEGYSGAVLEAFCCRRTVLVTHWGAFGEYVQDGFNGLMVQVKNPAAIKEKLLGLVGKVEDYNELCQNAYEVSKKFREDTVIKNILVPLI